MRGNGNINDILQNELPFGTNLQERRDTSVSGRTIYGYALPGTATSAENWFIYAEDQVVDDFIRRYADSGNGEEADFIHVWDDRLTLFPAVPASENDFALLLDGINQDANGGDIHNYNRSNAFSVSMWVKPNNIAASRILFAKAGAAPNVRGYMLRHNALTGDLFAQLRTNTTNRSHTFDVALTAGEYQMVTWTYNGGSDISGLRLWKNITKSSAPPGGNLTGTWLESQDFTVGQRNNSFYYSGLIDHMTVWSKELSDAEVQELYNGGFTFNPSTHSANANLVSWYRFGDGSDNSATVFDNIGADDLTLTNGPSYSTDEAP